MLFRSINTITGKNVSGRLNKVEIIGTKGRISAEKDNIRSLLGGLRSTLIQISAAVSLWLKDDDDQLYENSQPQKLQVISSDGLVHQVTQSGNLYIKGADTTTTIPLNATGDDSIIITGKGHGHGVGLSQWGARGMAEAGIDYKEILLTYYTDGKNNIYIDTI